MSTQDQLQGRSPDRSSAQASPHEIVGVGIAFLISGLSIMLASAGVLPLPEGFARGPAAIVFCAGLAFLFAGLTCLVRARAGMTDGGSEIPEGAPHRTQMPYRILAIGVAGAIATIGTWVAIGSGPRAFGVPAPFVEIQTTGDAIGRTIFGLGAVIGWIYVIALTVGAVRNFFDRRGA